MPIPQTAKRGKKSKRTDKRQARKRYWDSRRLAKRKVEALMESHGMTRFQAETYWAEVRGNRRTPITSTKTTLSSTAQSELYKKLTKAA